MCVGIIGANGRCGVCGKAGDGKPSQRVEHPHDDLHERQSVEPESEPEPEPEAAATSESDDERIPCEDDMCVGILDATGKCGTCGKAWRRPG